MTPHFYTLEEIRELRHKVIAYGLETPVGYHKLTDEQLQTICNGIGPGNWTNKSRKILTNAPGIKRYAVAAFLHDIAYQINESRLAADNQFLRNMKRIWEVDFGFWRWFRPSARIERRLTIPGMYAAVVLGGQEAFDNAKKESAAQ